MVTSFRKNCIFEVSKFQDITYAPRIALALMNGVPKPQANLLEKEGGIAVFLRKTFKWLMTGILVVERANNIEYPLKENYFYKVYLDGCYSKDCCPEYLKEENFYKLKNGLVDRISVHTMTITEFLNSHSGIYYI